MSFKRINGIKWILMGIALISFSIPFFCLMSTGRDLYEALTVLCIFCPFIGMACCVYGFFKKD